MLDDNVITTIVVICSILFALTIQLLLCLKVKNILIRLLPSLLFTASTIYLFIMMKVTTDWGAIGYALLFLFSVVLLASVVVGWGVWGIIRLIRRVKRGES